MRLSFLALLCLLIISFESIAQCDPPVVLDWQFTSSTEVDLDIESTSPATNYQLDFVALYSNNGGPLDIDTLHTQGLINPGVNDLSIDLTGLSGFEAPETYYYEALLTIDCIDGSSSSPVRFYVSPHSLLNDPGFEESELHFNTVSYLPDDIGFSFQSSIVVPPDSIAEEVDSISVLIDIGHTYLGDLSVSITNPQGITVQLREFPSGGGGNQGYSVLYQDGGTPQSEETYPLRGIYAPVDSLSAFAGYPKSGVWTVTVVDNLAIDYGILFGVGLYVNSSPCAASLAGSSFYDFNENGTQDADEPAFESAALFNSVDGQLFFGQADGSYLDCSSLGQGDLALMNPPLYYSAVPATHDLDLADGDYLTGLDFALQADQSVIDIEVDIFSLTPDRPGFDNVYYIQYQNIGTECATDITVSVDLDPQLEFLSGSDPDLVITGSGVELLVDELCPTESGMFEVHVLADSALVIGDTLFSTVSTSVIPDEVAVVNNTETLASVVVGSYDPNDKQVDQSEIDVLALPDGRFEYMIRFQNTGNYFAERVVVTDLIPEELDLSTLSVMASSHSYELSNYGNMIYFTFDDIFLPDSTSDLLGSMGFVRFEISPVDDLVLGDVIANQAQIYFDFNPAIITNDALTEVTSNVGLEELPDLNLGLFPNPVDHMLQVTWEEGVDLNRWEIVDTQSRVVRSGERPLNSTTLQVDVSEFSSGTYLFRVFAEKGTGTSSFIKK